LPFKCNLQRYNSVNTVAGKEAPPPPPPPPPAPLASSVAAHPLDDEADEDDLYDLD
jgi:hypothetical protein